MLLLLRLPIELVYPPGYLLGHVPGSPIPNDDQHTLARSLATANKVDKKAMLFSLLGWPSAKQKNRSLVSSQTAP